MSVMINNESSKMQCRKFSPIVLDGSRWLFLIFSQLLHFFSKSKKKSNKTVAITTYKFLSNFIFLSHFTELKFIF